MNILSRCLITSLLAMLFCAGVCVATDDDTEPPYFEEISRVNIGRPFVTNLAVTPDGRFALVSLAKQKKPGVIQIYPLQSQDKQYSLSQNPISSTEYDGFNSRLHGPLAIKITGGGSSPTRAYVISVFKYSTSDAGYDAGSRINGYEVTSEGGLKSIPGGSIDIYKRCDDNLDEQLIDIQNQLMFVATENTIVLINVHQNGSLAMLSEHPVHIGSDHEPIAPDREQMGDMFYHSGSEQLFVSLSSYEDDTLLEGIYCLVYSVSAEGVFLQNDPVQQYALTLNNTDVTTNLAIAPNTGKLALIEEGFYPEQGKAVGGIGARLVDINTSKKIDFGKWFTDHQVLPDKLSFNQQEDRLFLSGHTRQHSNIFLDSLVAFRIQGDSMTLINNSLSNSRLFHGHLVVTPDDCHILALAGGMISPQITSPDPDYLILYGINDPDKNCSVTLPKKTDLWLPLGLGLSAGVVAVTIAATLVTTIYCLVRKHNAHKGYSPIEPQ